GGCLRGGGGVIGGRSAWVGGMRPRGERGPPPCGAFPSVVGGSVARQGAMSGALSRAARTSPPAPRLTGSGADARRTGVKRLELKQVRVCAKCGRGRAELASGDGDR